DGIRDDLVTGVQTCALPISQVSCRCEAGNEWHVCLCEAGQHLETRCDAPVIAEVRSIVPCKELAAFLAITLSAVPAVRGGQASRSEEHTSELQSPDHLVCRL